jgi:nucleoside-diphosphate-sugar epimerase
MNIFITGASGYIGGSVAAALLSAGHSVSGLVRSDVKADTVRALGIEPVLGSLDDAAVLAEAAARADVVINAANADHEASTKTLLNALENSGKAYIHTSGSSVVGTQAGGQRLEDVYDESTTFTPSAGSACGTERIHPLIRSERVAASDRVSKPHLRIGMWRDGTQYAGAMADRNRPKARRCQALRNW